MGILMSTRVCIAGGRTKVQDSCDVLNKFYGLPARGIQTGPGIHVSSPRTYSPGAIGWTAPFAPAQSKTAPGLWFVEVDQQTEIDVGQSNAARSKNITSSERASLQASLAAKVPITDDFFE